MPAATDIVFAPAEVETGDGAVLLAAMREEMRELYDGLDLESDAMPRAGAAELGPPGGAFRVGRRDGRALCCGGVKRLDDVACEIKRMFVVPDARGAGVARALLRELEDVGRSLGYGVARLDTGPRQAGARGLYESEGYRQIDNFNANPIASYFAEKPLR